MGELPHSVWSGSFRLFGVDVKCHTLSNGERIIEADSMTALLDAMSGEFLEEGDDESVAFAKWRYERDDWKTE